MREQIRNSKEGRGWQRHVTSERQLDLGYGTHLLPEQHPRHLLGTSWAPPGTVSTGIVVGGADLALLTDGARVSTEYSLTLLTFTRFAGVVGCVFADLSLLAAQV